MEPENNEFKGFVKSEIKNVKDAAERNYEEHKTIFDALTGIRETLAALDERVKVIGQSRAAKYAMWGAWGSAVVMAAAALLRTFI